VAYGAALERRFGSNLIEGSNPSPSASFSWYLNLFSLQSFLRDKRRGENQAFIYIEIVRVSNLNYGHSNQPAEII
jgi:hypothetical protein